MFNYIWKNRIKMLEIKLAKIEQEKACAAGIHKWVMRDETTQRPYIRCEECYKQPEIKP